MYNKIELLLLPLNMNNHYSRSQHSINTLTSAVKVPINNYCYVCNKQLGIKTIRTHYQIYCPKCWNNEWLKLYLNYHA